MSDSMRNDETLLATARPITEQDELIEDEEKILAGRDDVNLPAMLTKDVHGG